MAKHLKLFENHADYEAFKETEDFILPNVSHCVAENDVHYNPIIPPLPVLPILYSGPYELSNNAYGINAQSIENDNNINFVEITYDSQTQNGTIVFDGPITTINVGALYCAGDPTSYDWIVPDTVSTVYGNNIGQSLELGTGITTIGYYDEENERYEYFTHDSNLIIRATTPPTVLTYEFEGQQRSCLTIYSNATIYVPAASVNAYKAAPGWSQYASQIQAIQ